jgi:N-acetylglucosaminyldiphosphoundecaprenol N-acetyl-beta-D-mannosaminyltransferase
LEFYGVSIYDGSIIKAVDEIVDKLAANSNTNESPICISATGAHGLVEAFKDSAFRGVLNQFYWNLPDGMPLVWWGRLRGCSTIGRCYGPDLFADLIKFTADQQVYHFFCGGKPGVSEKLKKDVALKRCSVKVE